METQSGPVHHVQNRNELGVCNYVVAKSIQHHGGHHDGGHMYDKDDD